MKKRLAYISALALDVGGIETHLLELFQAASESYEVILFSPASLSFKQRAKERGCHIRHWDVRGIIDLQAWIKVFHFLKEYRPHIVHVHDARTAAILRLLVKLRLSKFHIAYTVHLPPYYYRFEGWSAKLRAKLYLFLERRMNYRATDRILYVSKKAYEEALTLKYAPPERAFLTENGIDLAQFKIADKDTRKSLRKEAKATESTVVITCTARLSPEKRVDLVIRTVAGLHLDDIPFQLWIIGDGPESLKIKALVAELGLGEQVFFWGKRFDVARILGASDVFMLFSNYEGGRTIAVMEAQAAGLPCVLSDVGEHRWMVQSKKNGFIVPPDDIRSMVSAARQLVEDTELRLEMSIAAREHALQHYDKKNQLDRTLDIYASL